MMSASVLVADDDESVRLLLGEILEGAGHHVAYASDGAEAILALHAGPPDLLILDLMMPGTSGWDVLEVVDEYPRFSGLPVVVLTAYGEGEAIPSGRPVIHKPVDADLLLRLVEVLIAQRRATSFESEAPSDLLPRSRRRRGPMPSTP